MTTNLIAAPADAAEQPSPAVASPAGVEVRHGFAAIALAAAAIGAASFAIPSGAVRLVMLLAFLLVGPGAAVMCVPRLKDRLVSWALAVTLSMTIICGIAVLILPLLK